MLDVFRPNSFRLVNKWSCYQQGDDYYHDGDSYYKLCPLLSIQPCTYLSTKNYGTNSHRKGKPWWTHNANDSYSLLSIIWTSKTWQNIRGDGKPMHVVNILTLCAVRHLGLIATWLTITAFAECCLITHRDVCIHFFNVRFEVFITPGALCSFC